MELFIKYQNEGGVADERWDDTLESAKEIVSRWMDEGLVDWVEIRDSNEQLLAHLPKIIHRA